MLSETEDQQQPITTQQHEQNQQVLKSDKTLSKFLEMGKYFDYLIIDSNGSEHRLHKIVLACHSDYFQAIFDSGFVENQVHRSVLSFPDPRRVLGLLFRYMYTGELEVEAQTAVPLLQQAEYYQMTELCDKLKSHIDNFLLPKYVIQILKDAVEFSLGEIIDQASSVLAEHFDAVEWEEYGEDLSFLPVDVLCDILSHRSLTLDTEYRVYKVIANYTQHWSQHPKRLSSFDDGIPRRMTEQDCMDLYSKVYFEHLTVDQLDEAYDNSHVPKSLLCRGLLTALRLALGKPVTEQSGESSSRRLYTKQMDHKRGRVFTYHSDFDTNGVIYWLGSQDESSFKNPAESTLVQCFMSSIQAGRPSYLTSRLNLPTCTLSEKEAHVGVDLANSNFVLQPTAYTLKHGFWRDNVNLRRWRFEASQDGRQWDVLSVHDDEADRNALGGEYGTCTWHLPPCDKYYRSFRVVAIGRFFCQIAGIELYGTVLPRTLDAALKRLSLAPETALADE